MVSDKQLITSDIEAYLRRYQDKELLRFVAVGSVDDGKSTLIGRLLYDTGSIYEDQLEAIRKASHMEGADIDLSLLTDGLAAEREQGITIDVAYRYFSTDKRKFIIADTPGHVQYTRNMVTGASTANVALILVDARLGVLQQSRRHAYIASLLGIPRLAVCVNKMDLVGYDRAVFGRIQNDFATFTRALAFTDVSFFRTVLEFLESVPVQEDRDLAHFRYPVQCVVRPNLDYRGFAARIASGIVKKGDPIMVLPSGKKSSVRAIDSFTGELVEAFAAQSVTIRLQDEIDVSRGDMLVHPDDVPRVARTFDAHLVWMHDAPLDTKKSYLLKHTTQAVRAEVDRVHGRRDMDTLEEIPSPTLALNDIGRVTITAHRALFLDAYDANRETGSFILIDSILNNTVAAGMVIAIEGEGERSQDLDAALRDARESDTGGPHSQVSARERRARFGASEGVVMLPGGADALGYAIERRLFDCGAIGVVVRALEGESRLSAARAIADAGLLAIVPTESVLDEAAARARLEGRRLLVVRVNDLGVTSSEAGAKAVLDALRDRGWID
jgi:bifunctional enzyme CysN/CysC